jgi:hypothetical protein
LRRGTSGPRTDGEGRAQGDRKRDDDTLQESSLHFTGANRLAAAFQAALARGRKACPKAGCSQDWPPYKKAQKGLRLALTKKAPR